MISRHFGGSLASCSSARIRVVGEADSAAAAVDAAERLAPDAVLLDVRLGDGNGFEVSDALTRACPAPAVLLVSNNDYRHCHSLIKDSGARGFVLKSRLAATDLAAFWPTPAARCDSPRSVPGWPPCPAPFPSGRPRTGGSGGPFAGAAKVGGVMCRRESLGAATSCRF